VSRRPELTPPQAAVARVLGRLDGARIPGGCAECDAYQSVKPVSGGLWMMTVHHADCCPFLRRLEERAS
jgi:hypothetical protein